MPPSTSTATSSATGLAAGLPGQPARAGGFGNRDRTTDLTNRIGEGEQVVGGGTRCRRIRGESHDLPTARCRESLAVQVAQVVGVRLGVRRKGTQYGDLVDVDIGQGVDRATGTGGTRTTAGGTHVGDATPRVGGTRLGSPA
jgi:hypothetical protein